MRSPEVPPGAVAIRTYYELNQEAEAFFGDHYSELVIIGRPGIGKSEAFRTHCMEHPDQCHYLEGKITPLACFMEAYEHRHKLIVLDDAEGLWQQGDDGKRLLRQLTETRLYKELKWNTTTSVLKNEKVPRSFHTTSRVAIIMNRFVAEGKNGNFYDAIRDRGHLFYFDPTVLDVHTYAASWFHDQEIHDHVGQHLDVVKNLSNRTYNALAEKKSAGHDWKAYFLERWCYDGIITAVQSLEADRRFPSIEAKVVEFTRLNLGSRMTYFRYKRDLANQGQLAAKAPVIPVMGRQPEPLDRAALLAEAALENEENEQEIDDVPEVPASSHLSIVRIS